MRDAGLETCNLNPVSLHGMSAVAGIILILLGGATTALGANEVLHPDQLPPLSAKTTAGLGIIMIVIGLLHFRAPHKAFLLSVPVLLYFHVQMYFNSLFYFNDPHWLHQAGLAAITIIVLILSYKGYTSAKTADLPA